MQKGGVVLGMIFLIIGLALVGVGGYSLYQNSLNNDHSQPQVEERADDEVLETFETEQPDSETHGNVYINEELGFQITLPEVLPEIFTREEAPSFDVVSRRLEVYAMIDGEERNLATLRLISLDNWPVDSFCGASDPCFADSTTEINRDLEQVYAIERNPFTCSEDFLDQEELEGEFCSMVNFLYNLTSSNKDNFIIL